MNAHRPTEAAETTPRAAMPDAAMPCAAMPDAAGQRVRVVLPYHLRVLARVEGEVTLSVARPATIGGVLDALEQTYPTLRGTIRDQGTRQRRPFLRFYACRSDWSNQAPETPLPDEVTSGSEPLLIVGALAGG